MSSKFYRPARTYPPRLPSDAMLINAPPTFQPMQGGAISWLQYLLPLVGGLGSMVFIFAFPGASLLIIAAFAAMGLSSAGVGIFMGLQQRSTYKRQRAFER